MKPAEMIEKQLKRMNMEPAPDRDREILESVLQAQAQTNKKTSVESEPTLWRLIMHSKMTKFTAAAVVFIAVIAGITLIPGTKPPIALASVIDTLKNAVCISYDMTMGDDSPVIHDIVYGNRIHRETLGTVSIIDLEQQRILTLVPQSKQAITIDMKGLTEETGAGNKNVNYVDRLANLLTQLQEDPDFEVKQLSPEEEIDGQILPGASAKAGNVEVIIRTDPETELPVEIVEIRPGLEITVSNFDFDVTPEPSMFSMDPPEGYTLMDGQNLIDFQKDATEENFIVLLKMLAEINDGYFLQDISIEYVLKHNQEIGEMIGRKYEGMMKSMQAGMTLGRGLTFLRFFKGQGSWHYAGNGVKLGQAEEPIFWYQPQDSDTYRVIFGDLHVEEVAPEDLAALVANKEKVAGIGYQVWDKPDIVVSQDDEWHIMNTETVEVHSSIEIRKGPLELNEIAVSLPYDNAELLSAKFGDSLFEFESEDNIQYAFYPAREDLTAGTHTIQLIWQFPLENLELADYGYVVPLQSLLPATAYKITAVLELGCGFVWGFSPEDMKKAHEFMPTREPDNSQMLGLFSCDQADAIIEFGTCGLNIKPE